MSMDRAKKVLEVRNRIGRPEWPHGYIQRIYENKKLVGYLMTNEEDSIEDEDDKLWQKRTLRQSEKLFSTASADFKKHNLAFSLNTLPTEFFNHQILDLDLENEQQLFDFLVEWGFPYSPFRTFYSYEHISELIIETYNLLTLAEEAAEDYKEEGLTAEDFDSPSLHMDPWTQNFQYLLFKHTDDKEARSMLDFVNPGFFHEEAIQQTSKLSKERSIGNYYQYFGFEGEIVISVIEAKSSIAFYQNFIRHEYEEATSCMNSEDYPTLITLQESFVHEVLNKSRQTVGFESPFKALDNTLTAAISEQIIQTFADTEKPWKKCACETCDKWFKEKQSDFKRSKKDSIYCSKKCSDKQGNINKSRAAKNRIQH